MIRTGNYILGQASELLGMSRRASAFFALAPLVYGIHAGLMIEISVVWHSCRGDEEDVRCNDIL